MILETLEIVKNKGQYPSKIFEYRVQNKDIHGKTLLQRYLEDVLLTITVFLCLLKEDVLKDHLGRGGGVYSRTLRARGS